MEGVEMTVVVMDAMLRGISRRVQSYMKYRKEMRKPHLAAVIENTNKYIDDWIEGFAKV